MNKTQIEYAHKRIDTLLEAKVKDAKLRHTKPAQRITAEERARLIHDGEVTLRSDVTRIESYTDVTDVFDFSAYAWPDTVDEAAVAEETRELREEAQRLKDKIMLGDETTALAALEVFARKCGE